MADYCSACSRELETGQPDWDLDALAKKHLKEPGDIYDLECPCEGCTVFAIGMDEKGKWVEWRNLNQGEDGMVQSEPLGSAMKWLVEPEPTAEERWREDVEAAKYRGISMCISLRDRGIRVTRVVGVDRNGAPVFLEK